MNFGNHKNPFSADKVGNFAALMFNDEYLEDFHYLLIQAPDRETALEAAGQEASLRHGTDGHFGYGEVYLVDLNTGVGKCESWSLLDIESEEQADRHLREMIVECVSFGDYNPLMIDAWSERGWNQVVGFYTA